MRMRGALRDIDGSRDRDIDGPVVARRWLVSAACAVIVSIASGARAQRAAAEDPRAAAAAADAVADAVDLDGDGRSSRGDRRVFARWLERGGDRRVALAAAPDVDGVRGLAAFFRSRRAALDPSSPLVDDVARAGDTDPDCPQPTTRGVVVGPFATGVSQVVAVHQDPVLLAAARGQLIAGGDLFVARAGRDGGDSDGGVTRVARIDSVRGRIPLAAARVSDLAGGIPGANQLAFDPASGALFVTARGARGTPAVVRVSGLAPPVTSCSVVAFGAPPALPGGGVDPPPFATLANAYDVLVLPKTLVCGGAAGDLVVSESAKFTAFDRFGFLAHVTPTSCPGAVVPRYCSLSRPTGLAIGDFDGAAPFGIWFAAANVLGDPEIGRATPEIVGGRCSWDAGLAVHARFADSNDEDELGDLVFDPWSASEPSTPPSLFVTGARRIFRVGATAGSEPLVFAENLAAPRGISFPRSGVMLLSEAETDTLSVIDGWRFRFIRGDANGDLAVRVDDAMRVADFLFGGPDAPDLGCLDAADADDDGEVALADAVLIANSALTGGPAGGPRPAAPFPALGADPSGDLLGCRSYHASGAIGF